MRSQIFCLTVNGTSQEPTFRRLQVEMFLQFLLNIVCAHRSPIWTSMSSFAMCTVHLCYANFKGIKGAASIGRERSCLYSLPQWRSPPLSTVASMSTHPCAVRLQFLFLFIYLFKCMKSFKSKWREWSHFFFFSELSCWSGIIIEHDEKWVAGGPLRRHVDLIFVTGHIVS